MMVNHESYNSFFKVSQETNKNVLTSKHIGLSIKSRQEQLTIYSSIIIRCRITNFRTSNWYWIKDEKIK